MNQYLKAILGALTGANSVLVSILTLTPGQFTAKDAALMFGAALTGFGGVWAVTNADPTGGAA